LGHGCEGGRILGRILEEKFWEQQKRATRKTLLLEIREMEVAHARLQKIRTSKKDRDGKETYKDSITRGNLKKSRRAPWDNLPGDGQKE